MCLQPCREKLRVLFLSTYNSGNQHAAVLERKESRRAKGHEERSHEEDIQHRRLVYSHEGKKVEELEDDGVQEGPGIGDGAEPKRPGQKTPESEEDSEGAGDDPGQRSKMLIEEATHQEKKSQEAQAMPRRRAFHAEETAGQNPEPHPDHDRHHDPFSGCTGKKGEEGILDQEPDSQDRDEPGCAVYFGDMHLHHAK